MWLARLRRREAEAPHICVACGSDFVHPVHWHQAGPDGVWVQLRCGECERWREGTFDHDALDQFDRVLDRATGEIAHEADRLHREWRSTEVDAFAAALDRGLIDAGDFA